MEIKSIKKIFKQLIAKLAFSIFFVLLFVNPSKADTRSIVEANNRFCFDLYSRLCKIFRADYPYYIHIFIIQHNKTGPILFIGRVYEPKE